MWSFRQMLLNLKTDVAARNPHWWNRFRNVIKQLAIMFLCPFSCTSILLVFFANEGHLPTNRRHLQRSDVRIACLDGIQHVPEALSCTPNCVSSPLCFEYFQYFNISYDLDPLSSFCNFKASYSTCLRSFSFRAPSLRRFFSTTICM
jgi:hypothetical protein